MKINFRRLIYRSNLNLTLNYEVKDKQKLLLKPKWLTTCLAQENLSRKKRTRKSQKMDTDDVDDGVKQILALHPLSVKICVNTKGKRNASLIW